MFDRLRLLGSKIWWRGRIFFDPNFYGGGIYALILLIPLSIRRRCPRYFSLSGFLSHKVKSVFVKREGDHYLVGCPGLNFKVSFVSDDFFVILYPFFRVNNKKIEKILNNPFYVEGSYLTKNCSLGLGDVVIDAGANIGYFSIMASKLVGESGQIYSFEPIVEASEILENNIKLNNCHNIEVVTKALGEKVGEVLCDVDSENSFEGSSVAIKHENQAVRRMVLQTTIDDFVFGNNLEKVDFIKADIEGAERDMLHGAEKTIKKFKPKISIRTYHLPDDPEVIENILRSFVPEYKIERFFDKTLYAYIAKEATII